MASAVDVCGSPGHTPQFKRAAGCNIPEPPRNMPCSLVRQFSATPCTENSTFGCLPDGMWASGGCRGRFTIGTTKMQFSQLSRHWRDIVEEAYRFKLCNLTVNVEKAAEVVRRVVRHVENVKP